MNSVFYPHSSQFYIFVSILTLPSLISLLSKAKGKSLSHVQIFVTPWTVAYQAPLSMGFSRQEYWSGVPFPSSRDLPNPGIKPRSPALQTDTVPSEPLRKPPLIKGNCKPGSSWREVSWIEDFYSISCHPHIHPLITIRSELGLRLSHNNTVFEAWVPHFIQNWVIKISQLSLLVSWAERGLRTYQKR